MIAPIRLCPLIWALIAQSNRLIGLIVFQAQAQIAQRSKESL